MSFFDKVGDAFDWMKDTAAPAIGGALASAAHSAHDFAYDTPVLGDVSRALDPVQHLVEAGVGDASSAVNAGFSYGVARPVSTFQQVTTEAANTPGRFNLAGFQFLTDKDHWRQAWNASADISPGEAAQVGLDLAPKNITYDMTPEAMKAREDFFHNSWQGQLVSGTLDLALNLGADPTFLGAKAVKGAAIARNTFRGKDEITRVLDVNAGLSAAKTARETGMSGRMDKFFGRLEGKTSAEIMLDPVVKESDNAGVFASMFGRINEQVVGDPQVKRAAQRAVFGAMLGNEASIQELKDSHALLANELNRLSSTPITSGAVGQFSWADFGQGVLRQANAATPTEVSAQTTLIEQELARLEAATTSTGGVGRVQGSLKEQYQSQRLLNGIRESYINSGLGNMPVRVVGGALANRLPGSVAIKDPVQGFEDLRNTLAQTRAMDPTMRRQLLDNYVNAATDGDRQGAVHAAEAAIVQHTAAQYGLPADIAQKILEAGEGQRSAVIGTLSSRLYSAADDAKFIHYTDPHTGVVHAFSRPILQSQIEDHLSIIDPRELDKALKEATGNRLLERTIGQIGGGSAQTARGMTNPTFMEDLAKSSSDLYGSTRMIASDVLGKTTRVWKDAALMRLAYPARVQIDSQMRLGVHMGALAYLGSVGAGLKAEGKYLLSVKGGDKLSLRNVFREGDYKKSLTDMLTKADVHPDDIPMIVRKMESQDGGMADLANHMTDAQLARYRATGEWGYVEPSNKGWQPAWIRAVNRQIRNSPTAMKAVEGATPDELKQFAMTDPAARREWLNLKNGAGDDLDAWVHNVQAQVDHYLPTAEMRTETLAREVTTADTEKWFANVGDRMMVHGESLAPTTKSAAGAAYEKLRNFWYKFAAEAPETTMARAPLYSYAFKRNLKDIVARHTDETDFTQIHPDLMMQYRRSADRLARREVGKILFDTSHSSNLSHTFRFVSPFFSAWEDMMKKWGGLFYDKPWAGVRFEQAWQAPNNASLVVDENGNRVDAEGNRFDPNTGRQLDPVKDKYLIGKRELVTIPAAFLPKAVQDWAGIGELDPATGKKRPATAFSIDKNSFNIVFQGDPWWLPGAGPIVQVPVNYMVQHSMIKNTDSPIVSALLPYGVSDHPLSDQILPTWARNARAAFMQSGQEYANTRAMLLAQETDRWQNGERKTKPTGDEIDNMARNWFILKAITSDVSPVSMAPTAKTQFYVDQAHIYKQKYLRPQGVLNQYVQKYGLENGKAKFDTDYPDWKSQYLKDFPQWFDMSLSMSDNETGIVATDNAVDVARTPAVRSMIRANPDYGWYFVGAANQYGNTPGSAFSQPAYAQEETLGLRGQAKPEDALAKVEASKGWLQYQGVMTQVNMILHDRGLHSVTQKGAEDIKAFKQKFEQYLMDNNHSWKKDFLATDSGKVSNFLDVAKEAMASSPQFAKQPQNVALGRYMEARDVVQSILKGRQKHGLDDPSNQDVASVWGGIVSYLVNDNIGFEQVYNRLLQNDDPSKSIPGVPANG